jgi:hypothetical protein
VLAGFLGLRQRYLHDSLVMPWILMSICSPVMARSSSAHLQTVLVGECIARRCQSQFSVKHLLDESRLDQQLM